MAEAYIVDAVRSPVGRRGGGLSQVHPADLGAASIKALFDRNDVDPGAVEDVVFGCVDTIGPQAGDIARTCWLVAGLPDHVHIATDGGGYPKGNEQYYIGYMDPAPSS